ncbi:MAG: cytochrome c [Thiotrichaceae bacterium]|nr:cytochrome c [Thiotrichaceae bacterium]PCI14115.1 MAG: cytochrome C [Thiotrichales bacterium]
MKRLTMLSAATIIATITGCSVSNDFTPVAGNSGEEIFSNACIDCHTPENGYIYDISPEKANIESISAIISKGEMVMPAFPNIQGAELTAISEFVLAKNKPVVSEDAASE